VTKKIPLYAKVVCVDGLAGESIFVIINPMTQRVTHLVVQDKTFPNPLEWVVPVDKVVESACEVINLTCTREELSSMQPFRQERYLEQEFPEYEYAYSPPTMFAWAEKMLVTEKELNTPCEEAVVYRGASVEAVDGFVGGVGELILDPASGRVLYFTLMREHVWGKKETTIPLTYVDHTEMDTVYLKVEKKVIEDLPSLPINRPWKEVHATDLDVMVWRFQGTAQVEEALNLLKELENAQKIHLFNVALIMKDADGKVSLREIKEIDSRGRALAGAITGGLVGLLVGPGGGVIGAAGAGGGRRLPKRVEVGFSEDRLIAFQENLAPNTSAIVLLVEHRWFSSARQALARYGAEFFHQRFPDPADTQPADKDEYLLKT
jgi:uncharacterized membrane protein